MKSGHWFALAMIVLLGISFAIECALPKKFIWTPTYAGYDHQPFGCAVFDQVVANAWPESYIVTTETFYQLAQDSTEQFALLAIGQDLNFSSFEVQELLDLVAQGKKVMLVSSSFGGRLNDTLGISCSYSTFSLETMKTWTNSTLRQCDTLCWVDSTFGYTPRIFEVNPLLCQNSFLQYRDSLSIPLARKNEHNSQPRIAFSQRIGQGELILVSTPLMFTNYGILDEACATYVFRLLSLMSGDFPLYRTEAYLIDKQETQSPLRYFLSQPALRWAIYLTMITLVLFICFTAQRRQRAIPVIRQPKNRTLEFAQLIGTLYYQKKNHADLVDKKFTYFTETLRHYHIDIEASSNDTALSHQIAQKTGIDETEVTRLLYDLRSRPISLTDKQMKQYIDRMNKLIDSL